MPSPPDTVYAIAPKTKHPDEDIVYGMDFRARLPTGVTLSSVDSYGITPQGPVLGVPAVNAAPFTNDDGETVAAGQGVQIQISGGQRGTYKLRITCLCSDSRKRTGLGKLLIED